MKYKSYLAVLFFPIAVLLLSACSKSEEEQLCNSDSSISLGSNSCLLVEHAGLSTADMEIVEEKVTNAMSSINALMPIDNLVIRIVDDPSLVIPEIGVGGFNPNEHEVIIAINTSFNKLEQALEEELIPLVAHEVHHAKRRRAVGYGNTLLQAAVSEGLADHFSIEVAGIDPPIWAIALTGTELDNWINTASNTWNNSPYNHSGWFVGTDPDIPRWAGYSIGFELVKNYLAENSDENPSTLFDEPATSFQP